MPKHMQAKIVLLIILAGILSMMIFQVFHSFYRDLYFDAPAVLSVSFSPDGTTLAEGGRMGVRKDSIPGKPIYLLGRLSLWNVTTRNRQANLTNTAKQHRTEIYDVAFSPDGSTLATGNNGSAEVWDVQQEREKTTFRPTATFTTIDLVPKPQGGVSTVVAKKVPMGATIFSIAFSPDGKTLALASAFDHTVRLWDMKTGKERLILRGHKKSVLSVDFSPDGTTLMSTSDSEVILWDFATGTLKATLANLPGNVSSAVYSPNGKALAIVGGEWDTTGIVEIWDAEGLKKKHSLNGHTDHVRTADFSPDGTVLATGGNDGMIRLWEVATGNQKAVLAEHSDWVNSVDFSPDGRILASGSVDGTIRLWDTSTGECLAVIEDQRNTIWIVCGVLLVLWCIIWVFIKRRETVSVTS